MARAGLTMSVNQDRCREAWGAEKPRWITLLAAACDATSQRIVADKLGRSSGYVNRLLYRTYAGSYEEAETLVLAAYAGDRVHCPAWNETIPLASCVAARRRPHHGVHQVYARHCPTCPSNFDREKTA